MKIKIYLHNSIKTPINDDLLKIPLYFKSDFVRQYINEEIIYDTENTSKDYLDDTLFKTNEDIYDVVMFIYEQGRFPIYAQAELYSNKLVKIYVSVNPIEDNIEYSWKVMVHELVHAIWFRIMVRDSIWIPNVLDTYFKNEYPYAPDGNFAQQLALLKPYYKTSYIYFKPSEIVGLKPELVLLLDKARGIAGIPFRITSGFRTVAQNQAVGGSYSSAHLTGEAVDIFCVSSKNRWLMLNALLKVGFNRLEVCKSHLHCDISKTLSQNIIDFSAND